jgi:hypothetical protein
MRCDITIFGTLTFTPRLLKASMISNGSFENIFLLNTSSSHQTSAYSRQGVRKHLHLLEMRDVQRSRIQPCDIYRSLDQSGRRLTVVLSSCGVCLPRHILFWQMVLHHPAISWCLRARLQIMNVSSCSVLFLFVNRKLFQKHRSPHPYLHLWML